MQRFVPVLIPLLLLAACATPRERCIADARRPVAQIDRRIAVAQGNVARGYAIAEVRDVRLAPQTCAGRDRRGALFYYPCTRPLRTIREEPVAIDVGEERRKIAELDAARTRAARATGGAVAQCAALYAE